MSELHHTHRGWLAILDILAGTSWMWYDDNSTRNPDDTNDMTHLKLGCEMILKNTYREAYPENILVPEAPRYLKYFLYSVVLTVTLSLEPRSKAARVRTVAAMRAAACRDAPRCLARRKHLFASVHAIWFESTSQSPSEANNSSSSSGLLAKIVTYISGSSFRLVIALHYQVILQRWLVILLKYCTCQDLVNHN